MTGRSFPPDARRRPVPRARALRSALALAAAVALARGAAAQGGPFTPGPSSPPVVTRTGASSLAATAYSTGNVARFKIKNSNTFADDIEVSCSALQAVTFCEVTSTAYVSLLGGDSTFATVSYSTGAAGSGYVSLNALGTFDMGGATYGVTVTAAAPAEVTPDGLARLAQPGALNSATFVVRNPGTVAASYRLALACESPVVCGSVAPDSVRLAPLDTAVVTATYTPPASGGARRVTLRSRLAPSDTPGDSGWISVAAVDVASVNPGTTLERDLCLTVAVAPDAAFECGDLRVVHPLTSVRTLNKTRAPTLLYNSRHAQGAVLLGANVALGNGGTPSRVTAELWVRDPRTGAWTSRATGEWQGSDFAVSYQWPVRIALSYDGSADPTGAYDYRFDVRGWDGATPRPVISVGGRFIHVNRATSYFGAGWWLSGLERLHFPVAAVDSGIVWVGGDGSAREYLPAGTDRWVAAAVDRPDTLVKDGARYLRILPHGITVEFDLAGRHVTTINRLGHATRFRYYESGSAVAGRLKQIEVPIPGTTLRTRYCPACAVPDTTLAPPAPKYVFAYEGAQLRITAPGAREALVAFNAPTVTVDGDTVRTVQSVRDADLYTVGFGYGVGALARRISSRTDRRQALARFLYGAGDVLSSVARDSVAGMAWTETRFPQVGETQGLAVQGSVARAVAAYDVLTLLDGPRPDAEVLDHTRVWIDRFGAPTKIVNALGQTTHLSRGDPRFPALVTWTVAPNGFVTEATYDARGNIATTTAVDPYENGQNATTSYVWNQTYDIVEQVNLPMGEVSRVEYDPTNGNRRWQEDGRGAPSRTTFEYYGVGAAPQAPWLLRSVVAPGGARDSVAYDALGNLTRSVSATRAITEYINDELGRAHFVNELVDPAYRQETLDPNRAKVDGDDVQAAERTEPDTVWTTQTLTHDVWDRVRTSVTHGDSYKGMPSRTVSVENVYDAEGNLVSVDRWASPSANVNRSTTQSVGTITTRWRYDTLGRQVAEIAPDNTPSNTTDNPVDRTVYDNAGNAVAVVTRRIDPLTQTHDSLAMRYDALNRLVERRVPARSYLAEEKGISEWVRDTKYPYFPNDVAQRYTIPADVEAMEYDDMGRLVGATNGDARVRRSYFRGGALRGDTLRIRTLVGVDFDSHVYGIQHEYDLNGRPTKLIHPGTIAPSAGAYTGYAYDPVTGALATVTDPLGYQFQFHVNYRDELESLVRPAGVTERRVYDDDGRLTRDSILVGSAALEGVHRAYGVTYDRRGRMLTSGNTVGDDNSQQFTYDGLGMLVKSLQSAEGYDPGTNYATVSTASQVYDLDALGNIMTAVENQSSQVTGTGSGLLDQYRAQKTAPGTSARYYEVGTGRLALIHNSTAQRYDTLLYNAAGDLEFERQPTDLGSSYNDRRSYYGADGRLRAVDARSVSGQSSSEVHHRFEEFRYDALGRRILVYSRGVCAGTFNYQRDADLCNLDLVRRTVWAGDAELYEIQMPGDSTSPHRENDAGAVHFFSSGSGSLDLNQFFGRVAYTYGLGIDKPLGVTRIRYANDPHRIDVIRDWPAFTIVPTYDPRGQPIEGYVADGTMRSCLPDQPGRCVWMDFLGQAMLYNRAEGEPWFWHGTLLEDKRDRSGTLYRRNRVYNPQTMQFTQEDPVGLAGGLNLYGFAAGDPVNFSDPFGLCPPEDNNWVPACDKPLEQVTLDKRIAEAYLLVVGVGEAIEGAVGAYRAWQAWRAGRAGLAGARSAQVGFSKIDPNKLHHLFAKAQHKLGGLVAEFGGEAEAAQALETAASRQVLGKGITGEYEEVVRVGSQDVTVRGKVVNGVVRIGTAFIP